MISKIEDWVMQSVHLPEERRPIVRRDIEALQRAYREQFDHCQHLLVLQDLRHAQSRETLYEADPGRVGHCTLFGYESQIESTDVEVIINAFKRAYCADCSRCEPFERKEP